MQMKMRSAPSSALSQAMLADLRAMLDAAFPGDFSDDDWAHALGGTHVWIEGADGIVSHASLVERIIVCDRHRVLAGFVEAVATDAGHRHAGHGTRVMRRIGELIQQRYVIGVLSTGAYAFYENCGWERWRGPTFVDTPDGRQPTPEDDDDIMVLRTPRSPVLRLDGEIVCDWRAGDVW